MSAHLPLGGAGSAYPRDSAARIAASQRPAACAAATRIAWLDRARGLGIVLVVLGHALGGLIDSPLGAGLVRFRQAFFAIYTFHMPLFFLLAGLMVEPRVARGRGAFLRGLGPAIVWPYFLWSIVQFTVIWAMGSLVNRPAGAWLDTLVALPWRPVSQFWFLHALFWLHLAAAVALPRIGREGLVLLGFAVRPLAPILPLEPALHLIAVNFPWYALGVWLGIDGIERLVIRRPAWARAAALPMAAAVAVAIALASAGQGSAASPLAVASSPQLAGMAWSLSSGAAAVAGALAVIGLAAWPPLGAGALLAMIGRLTMPIFVLHVLFVAGSRIVLIRAGLADPAVLLPLIVAAGLAGPLLAHAALGRLGLARWLGLR